VILSGVCTLFWAVHHPGFASIINVITELNLSTHPFRNRTTPYLLAAFVLTISLVTAIFLLAKLRDNSQNIEKAEADVAQMRQEVASLKDEGGKVQQQLSPEQRELLVASHKLVANKSFGWSRLFADLEAVIPGTVSASRISVENIYRDGDRVKAELDFGVLSRDYQAVMGMIGTMNASGVFQAELRGQNLQTNQHSSYSEYSLHLIYTPAYGYAATPTDLARAGEGAGQ
jgi:Tfp pilus assembly protein PilN